MKGLGLAPLRVWMCPYENDPNQRTRKTSHVAMSNEHAEESDSGSEDTFGT